jgi:hypothetical protein
MTQIILSIVIIILSLLSITFLILYFTKKSSSCSPCPPPLAPPNSFYENLVYMGGKWRRGLNPYLFGTNSIVLDTFNKNNSPMTFNEANQGWWVFTDDNGWMQCGNDKATGRPTYGAPVSKNQDGTYQCQYVECPGGIDPVSGYYGYGNAQQYCQKTNQSCDAGTGTCK